MFVEPKLSAWPTRGFSERHGHEIRGDPVNKRPFEARELTLRVSELLNEKRFGTARRLLRKKLALAATLSKREQKILLTNLTRIELTAGKPNTALKMLKRRRALGFNRWSEKFDDIFETATVLAKTGEWIAARAELLELLTNKKCPEWDGLFAALDFYVDIEAECRKYMESTLESACKTAVKRYQIPISADSGASIEKTVKAARALYRAASQNYQELLLRAHSSLNWDEQAVLIRDLRRYVSSEKVGFFRSEGRQLLARAAARSGRPLK